jgi:hypothetical protein
MHGDSLKESSENPIFKELAEETIFAHIRETLRKHGYRDEELRQRKELL